ncbi:MAG: hypothetical protein WKG01_07690 [Kofleriaceae bacterium]
MHEMLAAAVLVDLTDYEPSKRTRQSGAAATTGKPEIIISPDRPGIVDAAERALASTGIVYVRSRQLVRVIRDHGARGWLERPKGSPVIVQIERDHLLDLLGRAATWIVIRDGTPKETSPPAWVAAMLMARGEWKLPQLEAIADAPVFRADGTIHEHPGYDERTRVIFDPCGVRFPSVPVSPSHADAKNALAELLDPFSEFPFVADSDRAATAAMVLSILGRAAIDGCVPMFASQAPAPGSGKGLLVDTVAMIATGRESPKMSPTEDDEETRKRLLAIALESPSMIMIDNVEGAIGGPSLAMALTAGEVRDRVLGSTKMVTATLRPVWAMTGNNIQLKGDLGRRVVPIDLDPKQEHPEDRTFNRGEPLTSYVARHRAALVVAALTVLRGFVVAGRPAHGHSAKGSFESWDRLVRAAIIWAGGADPLGGVTRIRTGADEDLDQLRALLVAWDGLIGCHAVTIADAIKRAGGSGALWDAFSAYCPNGKPPNARGLGYVLRAKQGRVAANLVLRRGSADRDGVMRWRVTAPTAAAEDVIERG